MKFKNDQTVYSYLNGIDSGPLLTKDQERVLIQNVEVYQKQILEQIVSYQYSRFELKLYLQNLESSGEEIIDISKKLDEESPKDLVQQIESKFKGLLKDILKLEVSQLNTLLEEVALTGTIIHGVVTEIKKKHSAILEVESKFRGIQKYFDTAQTYEDFTNMFKNSPEALRGTLREHYKLSDVKVNNKMGEWSQVLVDYDKVQESLPIKATFKEVKDIFTKISSLEVLAQKYKNELITKNLRLVVSRAKKHLNKGLEFEDLIQEGNIGLMKAVDKFDSSRNTKVSTYATWWIDQSIRRAISNKGKLVRVPTHIEWDTMKISQWNHKLTAELGRPPTLKELSEKSGFSVETLEDLQNRPQHEIGLDEELAGGVSIADIFPSDMESPHVVVERKILKEKIREILATLPPRTEKIIRLRFGIGEVPDDEGQTLQSIADDIGITKQGVRVVECTALKHLKKKAKKFANG